MSTQRYSVTPHPIETILTWVNSGEIAIPEIERPFIWEATKVSILLDSLDVREAAAWLPDEADEPELLDDVETDSDAAEVVASDTDGVPEKAEA